MRRVLLLIPLLFMLNSLAGLAGGQTASCVGWITDDKCGAKGANSAHKECAAKCMEQGGKLCFYCLADKKIYKLDDQYLAKQHLGHEVIVTGTIAGDSIKVSSIKMQVET